MKYKKIIIACEKSNVSLDKFFREINLQLKTKTKFIDEDFVPSYIRLMLMSFIEKELRNRDGNFEKKKELFFKRAKSLGYIEKNGLVQISMFQSGQDIIVGDFESQFVKIVI